MEERSYNNNSYSKKWIGKTLLLLGWTLVRIKPIIEVPKKLEKTKIKEE